MKRSDLIRTIRVCTQPVVSCYSFGKSWERGVILSLMGSDNEAQADFNVLLQADRALWQKRIDERTAAVKKLVPNQ